EYFTLPTNNLFYDYSGAFNVRTNKSSGSGDFDTVISAAQQARLNFIVLTDFNNFSPDLSLEAYYNNVLVIEGGEYGYLDARIINFDFQETQHLQGPGRSQIAFADLLSHYNPTRPEGIFVLAHPSRQRYQLRSFPEGLDGIEIMNLKSVWEESWRSSKISFIWTAFVYPFNAELAFLRMIIAAGDKEISIWDKLNQHHPTSGYLGSEAEAKLRLPGNLNIQFPSYSTLFSIAKNHILIRSELTGNSVQDRKKISGALRKGQFYTSLDILQDTHGFESYVSINKNSILPLGSEEKFKPGMELIVKLPAKPAVRFEAVIYRNGEKIMTSNSAITSYAIHSPGVYRSVVRVKVTLPFPDGSSWLNWIVANPFYIR
ncbi:MAG: hypothetical protein A2Z20_03635, partial [Bdellovibrionales bacterium RBG_16_40_8]